MAQNLNDQYDKLLIKLSTIKAELYIAEQKLHTALDSFNSKNTKPIRKAFDSYAKVFKRFDKLVSVCNIVKAKIDLG